MKTMVYSHIMGVIAASVLIITGCGGGGGGYGDIPPFTMNIAGATGDFNGDGLMDIAVAHQGFGCGGYVSIYLQQTGSPGQFRAQTAFNTNAKYENGAIAVQDLNGDGWDDIVAGYGDGQVAVILQNPSSPGEYIVSLYSVGANFNEIVIGDLNQDGRPDIAVTSYYGSTGGVVVFFQSSSSPGQFLPAAGVLSNLMGLGSIDIEDLNGDGINDFVVTSHALNTVLVHYQNPGAPGTFTAGPQISSVAGPSFVVARDLNGDDTTDLVVRDRYNGITILLGDAAQPGQFLPGTRYTVGSTPSWVDVADLNNDSFPDIVVTNWDSYDVTVLLQSPGNPGQFIHAGIYHCGDKAYTVRIADLNADGRPDFLVTATDISIIFLQEPANPGYFTGAYVFEYG